MAAAPPPPPPRLSISTLALRFSPSFCATSRVTTSELPPGGNGTMMVIGRDGKSDCASEGSASVGKSVPPRSHAAISSLLFFVMTLPRHHCGECLRSRRAALAPQFGCGKPRAFGERAQLRPHDARVNPLGERALGEAAVGAGQHVVAAD